MNGICTNGQRPRDILTKLAAEHGLKPLDDKFHEILDGKDPLSHLRKEFCIPKVSINIDEQDRESCLDFCSHSLGLQPKRTKEFVNKVLTEWADRGSMTYRYPDVINIFSDVSLAKGVAELVGAYSDEVALMNTLTVNLNLLLTSFYSPTKSRNKILLEGSTFPTNYFSCASHIKQRGFNVKDSLLLLEPRKGELILHTSDILDVINDEGESIALVLLSGVQYLTGQLLDMKTITDVAHAKGCMVGFDLAQAIGSVELHLHSWDVDFAVWGNFKFMNSGPGTIGGAFMHLRHERNNFPKLLGWWGYDINTRFDFQSGLEPLVGINAYRNSAPSPLNLACVAGSLEVFKKTSISKLRNKSILLIGYLEMLLLELRTHGLEIVSPSDYKQRGGQLTVKIHDRNIVDVHEKLKRKNVNCSLKDPDMLRISANPFYTRYWDVFRLCQVLRGVLSKQ